MGFGGINARTAARRTALVARVKNLAVHAVCAFRVIGDPFVSFHAHPPVPAPRVIRTMDTVKIARKDFGINTVIGPVLQVACWACASFPEAPAAAVARMGFGALIVSSSALLLAVYPHAVRCMAIVTHARMATGVISARR